MRKHSLMLLASTAFALAASQSLAADLPRKAPAYVPPAPPPITWTGCYIGGNIGGIFGNAKANFGFGELSTNNSGFAGGGQIGCDYQFAGGWVIGLRNMFDGTSLSRDRTTAFTTLDTEGGTIANSATASFRTNWFDTLTGRIGYAFAPSWLLYGQGGVAWANATANLTINGVGVGEVSKTRTGWTAGGGVEWRFAPNWSAFLEGNFMDFGDQNHLVFDPTVCVAGCTFNTSTTATTILVGVNYRFGWGKAPY